VKIPCSKFKIDIFNIQDLSGIESGLFGVLTIVYFTLFKLQSGFMTILIAGIVYEDVNWFLNLVFKAVKEVAEVILI
jgi:hypothetical protein